MLRSFISSNIESLETLAAAEAAAAEEAAEEEGPLTETRSHGEKMAAWESVVEGWAKYF